MTSNLDKIINIFKMTGCAVLGCRSNNNKKLRRNKGLAANNIKINFHRFPKNKTLCDIWVKQCGRKINFNLAHAKICSVHFLADCYERNLQHELLSITPKCRKLKPEAIPTERLPVRGRLKTNPQNYLGKRICHRRNATETNTYEDENSQPEQNQITSVRSSTVKEEMKFHNQPILPKPVAKPIKFVFVNAAPSGTPQPLVLNPNAETASQQIITASTMTNGHTPILRSTLMLPPGTTIKQIPIVPNSSEHETKKNQTPPSTDKSHDGKSSQIPRTDTLFLKITKHKRMNLAINRERLEIEKSRLKFHELFADKIFTMLVNRAAADNSNCDHKDNNLSYCNIKKEI